MFGADTPLVFDAIQMVAVAAVVTGGGVYLLMRSKRKKSAPTNSAPAEDDLEQRVRVLERIATDPATRLATEFEELEQTQEAGKEDAR